MKHDLLGDNYKYLKGSFDKSHMQPAPSNMIPVYSIY